MRMVSFVKLAAIVIAVASFSMVGRASASTIAEWNFPTTTSGTTDGNPGNVNSNVLADVGSGTAEQLGMTNGYTYTGGEGPGSVAKCDILATPGTAFPSFTPNAWRIRGNSNSSGACAGKANGWNTAAPQYTQCAEFDVNTTGYQNIQLSYDWYCTTQGVANMQQQYNLNVSNTAGWTNIGSVLDATSNDWYGAVGASPTNTLDLSSIPGANNDPTFGIRLVSCYDPNPADPTYGTYAGAGRWGV